MIERVSWTILFLFLAVDCSRNVRKQNWEKATFYALGAYWIGVISMWRIIGENLK